MRKSMTTGGSFVVNVVRVLFASMCMILLAVACSSDTPPLADLAQGCLVNTDCNSPLVCAFRRCHTACASTRDCPDPLRCVASDRPFHVCQLASERECVYNSDCPKGQVCAGDAQCRDQCQGDADCLAGQTCVAGSCAEKSELRDGGLLEVTKEAGPLSGQPCSYTSECAANLVCRNGLCQMECLSSIDCLDGRQCVKNRCQVPVCSDTDAGAGVLCAFTSDCPVPLVCRTGTCTCECRQNADCPTGYDCLSNRCAPSETDTIGPEGGVVVSPDRRLTVQVPPGALGVRLHLTVDLAEAWPSGAVGPVFEVRPSGTTFAKAISIVYSYQAADIAPVQPAALQLAVANGSTWMALSTFVNTAMSTATAETMHLSTYGLIGGGTPVAAEGGTDAN